LFAGQVNNIGPDFLLVEEKEEDHNAYFLLKNMVDQKNTA
jgi:hypothetical protein